MADPNPSTVAKDPTPRDGHESNPPTELMPLAYSRKDKSLGLLCEKFVNVYGQREGQEVCLDAAAIRLGVERRRIYDIVNVLESVGVVTRKGKNCYVWQGAAEVAAKIEDLRRKAAVDCFGGPEDFRRSAKKPRSVKGEVKILPRASLPLTPLSHTPASSQDVGESQSDASQPVSTQDTDNGLGTDVKPVISKLEKVSGSRKEKSLGVLSQRFVQLFLMAGGSAVSLEQAALQLMGQTPSDTDSVSLQGDTTKILKTKVRRLYDIANILSSLNIIQKVHIMKRKPAFQWVGIQDTTFSPARLSMKRSTSPSTPAGNTSKRRKYFSNPTTGFCDDSRSMSLSPGDLQSKPLTMDREMNVRLIRDPFDAETLASLKHSLSSMPQTFSEKWQDWITKAQALVQNGVMTFEEAENGIAQLLGPRKTNGERVPIYGVPSQKAVTVLERRNCPSEAESDHLGQQKAPSVKTDTVKSLELDGSPTTDVEEGSGSCDALASMDENERSERVSMELGQGEFGWMDQDYIDAYMKQAKEAGPAYAKKAEDWLRQLRQWEQTWAPYRATLQAIPGSSVAVQPQNGV